MQLMEHSIWAWVGFGAFILLMLVIDLGLLNRKARSFTPRRAAVWSAVWVALALAFAGIVFLNFGSTRGLQFLTGYLIELSLSVDNLFVFLLVFSYFKVPDQYQHRVLFWGVLGALLMRITMIFSGAALINYLGHQVLYLFGAFLVYTGIKMFRQEETNMGPERNPLVRFVTRFIPITRYYDGKNFFTRVDGQASGTLLLLVLMIVEITDLMFAVDSIPAIFAVTNDTFIIYTSNVFAILGLRTLYFLLASMVEKFHYLNIGLAVVLTFIGIKMLLPVVNVDISIHISLAVVAIVLFLSVAASFIWPRKVDAPAMPVTPEDFSPPLNRNEVSKTGSRQKRQGQV